MNNLFENTMNQQILKHLSEGLTIKEIAVKVFLSKRAVENRIRKMKGEASAQTGIQIRNNIQLVAHANSLTL